MRIGVLIGIKDGKVSLIDGGSNIDDHKKKFKSLVGDNCEQFDTVLRFDQYASKSRKKQIIVQPKVEAEAQPKAGKSK